MKFKFVKEEENVRVLISDENMDFEFDYIRMINTLYVKRTIEDSVFEGLFLQDEIDCLKSFVQELSEKIISIERT